MKVPNSSYYVQWTFMTWLQLLLLSGAAAVSQELVKGFKVTPSSSGSGFQAILTDATGNFSMGFLRINGTKLALAVVHAPSSELLWQANPTQPLRWSGQTQLHFNGSLVLSDPDSDLSWSTHTDGDRLVLLNSSNLQILKGTDPGAVVWQSFDFPTDTIVENQNFTSNMSLVSSNGLYTMRLGDNFIGLYLDFRLNQDQLYWKHKALQAKVTIVDGAGPIYVRVESDGYIAMYQNGTAVPADIEPFRTFQRSIHSFILVRLEPDGNLKGYYWNGTAWVIDYVAVTEFCELPASCGAYGLCAAAGDTCSCLDNKTAPSPGRCSGSGSGDFCGAGAGEKEFQVLRRSGVELPYKELITSYQTAASQSDCENLCAENCTCWGAVYNNATGFCYGLDYPIQTLVSVSDPSKIGYFKMREKVKRGKEYRIGYGVGVMMWVLIGLGVVGAIAGFGFYRYWRKNRGVIEGYVEDGSRVTPGPYKDLNAASFRSIEMAGGS